MAQFRHKAPIRTEVFPLLSEDYGYSVVVGNTNRGTEDADQAHPQTLYAHNMMPTKEGFTSIGFTEVVTAISNDALVSDVRIIFGNARTRLHMAVSQNGAIYILKPDSTTWLEIVFNEPIVDKLLTIGTVNGVSYIYFQGVGAYIFNEASDLFTPMTLIGLDLTAIVGITASYGYLIAYTTGALAWSSTIAPNDFIPSAVTGAGGGGVADVKGDILFAVPNALGILVYTEANMVAATFTGNRQYPFKTRGIENSQGALNLDLVAYEANSTQQFSMGKGGLQAVDSRQSQPILPEVTDFLAGERIEDFDETTITFSVEAITTTMLKQVKLISSRYLVISYGKDELTHALIYDLILKRLGKIKTTHTDVFEYIGGVHQEVVRHTVAFLKADGCVHILDFAKEATSTGVLVLGKYQYVRARTLKLQEVTVANIFEGDALTVHAMPSLNGADFDTPVSGYLMETGATMRRYLFDSEGLNVSVALIGKVDLNSVVLAFTVGGRV